MTAVLRVVSNVIDYNMNALEAQTAPRVTQAGRDLGPTFIDSRVPARTIEDLKRMGDVIIPIDPEFGLGVTTGIVIDQKTGWIYGAAERNPPYALDGTALGF